MEKLGKMASYQHRAGHKNSETQCKIRRCKTTEADAKDKWVIQICVLAKKRLCT